MSMATLVRLLVEYSAYTNLTFIIGGFYIWEVLMSMDYEYSIIMGKRKFTHASPLYIACRWCTLLALILEFIDFEQGKEIIVRCHTSISGFLVFFLTLITLAYLSASALTILRIFALWERNRAVITIASTVWLANAASFVYGIITLHKHSLGLSCLDHGLLNDRIFVYSTFAMDLVLLVLMLCGILRWKIDCEMGRIWWVLFTQGLAWFVIFTLAEVPPMVVVSLNLDEVMDQMFTSPLVVVMTVAASRMYRSLANSSAFHGPPVTAVSIKRRSTGMGIQRPQAGTPDRSDLAGSSFGMGGDRPESYDLTDDAPHDVPGVHEVDKCVGGDAV